VKEPRKSIGTREEAEKSQKKFIRLEKKAEARGMERQL
jgi:hypothetical protein